jgi:hypothetical protein
VQEASAVPAVLEASAAQEASVVPAVLEALAELAVSAVLDVRAASVVLGGRVRVNGPDRAVASTIAATGSTPAISTSTTTGAVIGTAGAIIPSVPGSRSGPSQA